MTRADDWTRIVDDAVAAHGRLDGLVNNAAVILEARPFLEESPEEFARVLDVNVMGVWLGMQSAGRAMTATGGGAIVNISSTAGMVAHPRLSSYGTSKWAVRGLTKYGARELGPIGVRVNSVHPGGMMGTTMFPGTFDRDAYERPSAACPCGGSPTRPTWPTPSCGCSPIVAPSHRPRARRRRGNVEGAI